MRTGLVLSLALLCLAGIASAAPILVDFGNSSGTPAPWNTLGNVIVGTALPNMTDSSGAATGISLTINDDFNGVNANGDTASAVPYPITAKQDSFFGNDLQVWSGQINPTGGFLLSGMNTSAAYSFTFFASRMGVGDNRETKYTVIGASTETVYLNAANNATNTVSTGLIAPDANGQVQVNLTYGPNNTNGYRFFYIGALEINVPEPATLSLLCAGVLAIRRRK